MGIVVFVCRRQKNEFSAQPGNQFGDDQTKGAGLGLNRENDGNGIGRPAADLEGVDEIERRQTRIKLEGLAKSTSQARPVEFPDFEVSASDGEVGAVEIFVCAGIKGDKSSV